MNDGKGFVQVNSTVLIEANGAWFSVSEAPFPSEVAAQMTVEDTAYRLGAKLAARIPNTFPSDIIIEKARSCEQPSLQDSLPSVVSASTCQPTVMSRSRFLAVLQSPL